MLSKGRSGYVFLSMLQAKAGFSVVSCLGDLEPDDLLEASPAEFAATDRMTQKAMRAFEELKASFDATVVSRDLQEKGVSVLTLPDAAYPARLREIPDPPPALFVSGALGEGPAVSVVGTRAGSSGALEVARALGRALGERGVCVVSGLALGVDAAAHRGAIEAGARTVGVLGCGIDVVYPRNHGRLYEEVRGAGALVSEYCLGEPPLAWRFPARNRVIAGFCDATVVVEAPDRSGALITARHAAECGRDVWAVPGPLGNPGCRGSNKLLADGAGVLWDVSEFVDQYAQGHEVRTAGEAPRDVPASLPSGEAAVLGCVGNDPTEVDAISDGSGLETPRVLSALSLLELKGYVTRGTGGAYSRRTAL